MNCISCGTKFDSASGRCPRCAWNPSEKLGALAGYLKGELVNNRYTVRESLGIGRLGVVIKAIDLKSNRAVALKIIHPALIPDEDAGTRFMTGMQAMMANPHEGRAKVLDVGRDGNRYYFARELLFGATLSQLMEDQQICGQTFPVGEAVQIMQQLARALTSIKGAHHGAFSPSKIWVLSDKIVIVDHGLATHLPPGAVWHVLRLGSKTNWYLAPELQDNRPADSQSDVYSMAAILGEMLSLAEFDGRVEIFRECEPEFPLEIDALLRCALSTDPDARYFDAKEFVAALHDVTGTERSYTMPPDNTAVVASNFLEKLRSMSEMPPPPSEEDMGQSLTGNDWPNGEEGESLIGSERDTIDEVGADDADKDDIEVTRQVPMDEMIDNLEEMRQEPSEKEELTKSPPTPALSSAAPPIPAAAPRPGPPPLRSSATSPPRLPSRRPAPGVSSTAAPVPRPSQSAPSPSRAAPPPIPPPSVKSTSVPGKSAPPPVLPRPTAAPPVSVREGVSRDVPGRPPGSAPPPLPPPSPGPKPASKPDEESGTLEGINPRFLRAAAKLEKAKISKRVEESAERGEEESEEEWRRRLEETSAGSVISFLPPTTTENPKEVKGFPRNQQRGSKPSIPPVPPAKRSGPPPVPTRRKP